MKIAALSTPLSRMSIRQALYALVFCAVCPALAVIVLHGVETHLRAREAIRDQTLNVVKYAASQQRMLSENTRVILHTLSRLPEVRQADPQAMHALFRNLRDVHPNYANIIRMDVEGALLAASQPLAGPISVKDRKYFKDALRTGRFSAGEFVVGRLIGEPVFQYSLPVSGEAGEHNGVLAATMRLNTYDALFANVTLPPSWRFVLLDHNGIRLLRLPALEAFPLGSRASSGVLERINSAPGDEGTFTTLGPDGIEVTYAFVKLRLAPGEPPYMTAVLGFPAPTLAEAILGDVLPDVLWMLGVLVLALLIARLLGAAAVAEGLGRLRGATRRLSGGEFAYRVGPLPACREIRELGQAFDSMGESLSRESAQRLQAEGELDRARAYIANILDSMPSPVIGVDSAGRVTHWNRAAESQAALPAGQIHGSPLDRAFTDLKPHMPGILAALAGRAALRVEREQHGRDAEPAFRDLLVYPLTGEAAGGGVVRVDDVTQRVRIEEMMVQSEKMLSLGGLAAGMAHEINNPLGAIMQSAQVVRTRFDPASPANRAAAAGFGCSMESVRAYAENRGVITFLDGIREAGHRAARIVSNMLDFSRKSQERRLASDVNALLERAVELALSDFDLKKKYDFRTISIIRDYAPDLPEIPCSRTEIEQVVLNLLKNAAQAMGGERAQGGAKPVITLRTALDGQFARIEVEDNGPGMDESVRKRIFEPFFTTKPVGEGTGLGLSVSYFIIVTNHGGRFEVESAPGKGTRFILRLPLAGGSLDPVPPPAR